MHHHQHMDDKITTLIHQVPAWALRVKHHPNRLPTASTAHPRNLKDLR